MNEKSTTHSGAFAFRGGLLRRGVTVWFALVLTIPVALDATGLGGHDDLGGKRSLSTMTVNLYIGAGTEGITALDPTDPNFFPNLISEVTQVYYTLLASQPPLRIQRVAGAIAARQPDVVAVEEATTVRVQSPGDLVAGGTVPATTVVFDYEQLLLTALAARGMHYAVAVRSDQWDVEMPMLNMQTGVFEDVRQTDHELILVRKDLPPGQLSVSNPQVGHFVNVRQFPAIGLSVTRGWCSVDLFVRGQTFRYICVHLEEETSPALQVLQAHELLTGPVNTHLPVVLVGDFNSDPLHRDGSVAYDVFPAAGFRDVWAALNPRHIGGGLTWGHDEFLSDPAVKFDRRIDLVFVRGPGFVPAQAEVVDLTMNRTLPPLWASDHAALAAEIRIERGPFACGK